MSLEVLFHKDQNSTTIEFRGIIDENSNFENFESVDTPSLCLDLKGVTMLNSVGLRNWIRWVRSLPKLEVIELKNCTVPVVNQMSVLEGFIPLNGIITSFEVPYQCENCGHDYSYWAKRGDDFYETTEDRESWSKVPAHLDCPKCKTTSEMDVIPAKYFRFLTKDKISS